MTIFTTIIKEKLREIEAYAYNTDKIVKFVEIYEYMANNTCWIYDDKYKEFRHMVLKKLKEYYYLPIYPIVINFFPIKLCKHCLCFTGEHERCCNRCIMKKIILRKLVPKVIANYVMTFAGVESNKTLLKQSKS